MINTTHSMVSDTAMRYRQLRAALGAIIILDWENMRRLVLFREPGLVRCPEWDGLFDTGMSGRYAIWFEENFGDYPALLRQWGIDSVRNHLSGARPSRGELTLRQILIARYRSSDLNGVYFDPPRSDGFVEAVEPGSIRLRLYDQSTRSWGWQKAAFGRAVPRMVSPPQDDGTEMTPIPTMLAKLVIYTKGYSIAMHNNDDLLVEPVIEMLPFRDLTIPSSYWQLS